LQQHVNDEKGGARRVASQIERREFNALGEPVPDFVDRLTRRRLDGGGDLRGGDRCRNVTEGGQAVVAGDKVTGTRKGGGR
jgi:hypothetical protein